MNLVLKDNLNQLSVSLRQYAELSKKTEDQVLSQKAGQLAWMLYRDLIAIAPTKGSIRAEQLARMRSGTGIYIRNAVLKDVAAKYHLAETSAGHGEIHRRKNSAGTASVLVDGKRMNFYALAAERELTIREAGRKFSAVATPRPNRKSELDYEKDVQSRFGFTLSRATKMSQGELKTITLSWLGAQSSDYQSAADAIRTPRQQALLNKAITETTADIQVYIERKLRENARATGL